MGRLPASAPAYTATVFQCREKGVAQEGLRISQQSIPLTGGNFMDGIQAGRQHRQLGESGKAALYIAARLDAASALRARSFVSNHIWQLLAGHLAHFLAV